MLCTLLLLALPQQPDAPVRLGSPTDERGWPIVDEPAAPLDGGLPVARPAMAPALPAGEVAATGRPADAAVAWDGMFAAIGSPRALRGLGGVTAWWRITVHGQQGETIGVREVTQRADLATTDRDRLEFADGRVCGRLGTTVFAERHGLPWQTWVEASTHDLELFSMHLRLPWGLADPQQFAVAGTEAVAADGEESIRLRLVRRPTTVVAGPELVPQAPTDRFELRVPARGGPPTVCEHTFATSGQRRTLRLEDWRPVGAVRLPHRRVYVDATGRPTTTLELLRIETGQALAERDFRLQ